MDKVKQVLDAIWNVLKHIGAVIVEICKRAWELIKRCAPKVWSAVVRFCKTVWSGAKRLTAKLLNVDENLNKRAVYITMASFAAIIVLFIIAVA